MIYTLVTIRDLLNQGSEFPPHVACADVRQNRGIYDSARTAFIVAMINCTSNPPVIKTTGADFLDFISTSLVPCI